MRVPTVVLFALMCLDSCLVSADFRQDMLRLPGKQQNKPQEANPFLDKFLDAHVQPRMAWDNKDFRLIIDDRLDFKPMIRTNEFQSIGEPWPMPRHYVTQREHVVRLVGANFRMNVLNKSCDILEKAIKRYMKIVLEHSLEEPYSFYFNYNEKTEAHQRAQEQLKYKKVSEMASLDIYVSGEDNKYPHIEMDESYNLTVKPGLSKLVAKEVWGALRGLETFSQLVFKKRGTDELYARETEIEDRPRFPHRGILVDTSRHFIHKHVLKNVIEAMSYNKLNTLHWHIVDDNSFPYQSEVFPNLSAKGAFHPTLVYTISDIKDLVEYGRLRGVRIVPEFDTPGHTFSWLGHPEIKATCYSKTGHKIEGPAGPIHPTSNVTYDFMRKLFTELYEVFPDTFFHLGGDELHSDCWATNPEIVQELDKNGIPAGQKGMGQTYINKAIGYYFKRLLETLKDASKNSHRNASFIMWEDVYKNTKEIHRDSIMEVWYGKQVNVKTYNDAGYRAIYSSCWYMDYYHHGVTWHTYYNCEPSPYSTEEEERGKLLGGEAAFWAEYITSDTLMTFMWPRASAPAERLWSPRNVRDVINAARRLNEQRCRMIYRGLPTGQVGGPDYCLRYKNVPLGGDSPLDGGISQDGGLSQDGGMNSHPAGSGGLYLGKKEESFQAVGGNHVSLSVLTEYHTFLPVFNVLVSAIGLYIIWKACRFWRRTRRKGSGRN